MPIPNQADQVAGRDHGVPGGLPAANGSNEKLYASYNWNRLASGTPCAFYDASGVRHQCLMGHIRSDLQPVQISVRLGGTEYANIPYSDAQTPQPYTWRFVNE